MSTPTSEALSDVREWQRQRRENTRLMFGLAAINTGLEQLESGKTEDGIASVRAGLDFLRPMIGGGQ